MDPAIILFPLIQPVSSSRDCARSELRAQCVLDEIDTSYVVFLNSGTTLGPSKFWRPLRHYVIRCDISGYLFNTFEHCTHPWTKRIWRVTK
jgi:hypothetical protein